MFVVEHLLHLTRFRLHLAIYFLLLRGRTGGKGCTARTVPNQAESRSVAAQARVSCPETGEFFGNKTATARHLPSIALVSEAKGCGFDPRRAHVVSDK